jgi:2,4-dienoyl-CoA reductase-like NADH-dependent reductase (Old Yellow Enzyme family)/thioredoxin reductase
MPSAFEETYIGTMALSNRLIMAPVKTGYGNLAGEVTQRHINFYLRRAAGGVGLITPEPMYIHPSGKELSNQIGLHQDRLVDGLKRLTYAIHQAGAKVAAHLNHAGRMANPKTTHLPVVSASAVPCPATGLVPKALTRTEIKKYVDYYCQAAGRAKRAGFDAIELQFGHGYLVAQFLSLLVNKRTDDYGGSLENRLRFGLEVLKAVKSEVGANFPVICRLSAKEYVPYGLTLKDSKRIAMALETAGADALHIGGGSTCESPAWYFQHSALPEKVFLADAMALKMVVSIPIIAVGRLGTPEKVKEALDIFGVDFVALGRPLIADPDFPLKMQNGNFNDICLCGSCLQGCLPMVKAGKGLSCVINPMVGREGEIHFSSTDKPRNVTVIGGGPAGLEAGIIAAARGHHVDLYEKDELGGQFRLACKPPNKESMSVPYRNLLVQIRNQKVNIHLGRDVKAEDVIKQHPDVVVVSTGAEPIIPGIQGLERIEYTTAHEVLADKKSVGQKVLIIGGGMVGMETAELLAQHGKEITVIEMLDEIARDMEKITRALLMKRIQDLPIKVMTSTVVKSFEKEEVIIEKDGKEEHLPKFDTVVFAVGTRPVDELSKPLRQHGLAVYTIGDAVAPRKVFEAIHEGFEVGLKI